MWSLWLDTAVNLIDWQAIQQILDVHDCVQVWICGGKRWHSWCLCGLLRLHVSRYSSPEPESRLTQPSSSFPPEPHFSVLSFFVLNEAAVPSRSYIVSVFFDDIIPVCHTFLGIRFISDQSAELKQNCQVVLCYYIFWFIFRFLLNWRVESCFYHTVRFLQGFFLWGY